MLFMTLVGVGALYRRVLGERSPLAWTALFVFPGIFCYDSGLVLGADHVAALFAAPVALLALRFSEAPNRRWALLLGAAVAAALDTKYTAVLLLPLPLALVAKAALGQPDRRRTFVSSGLTLLGSIVVLTAPHWLKNAVYYGDPLFPLLRRFFPAHPWQEAAEAPLAGWYCPVRAVAVRPRRCRGHAEDARDLLVRPPRVFPVSWLDPGLRVAVHAAHADALVLPPPGAPGLAVLGELPRHRGLVLPASVRSLLAGARPVDGRGLGGGDCAVVSEGRHGAHGGRRARSACRCFGPPACRSFPATARRPRPS